MENNDPAVLFYTADFLTGVMDMDMEERGQYITLLCYQHQKGHFNEKTIRLILGYEKSEISENVLKHFQIDEEGLFYNNRMDEEKLKRSVFIESRKANGKLGGRPKKPSAKPSGKPSAKPSGKPRKNLIENDNDNINNNINNNLNNNINNNLNNSLNNSLCNIYTYIEEEFKRLLSPSEIEIIGTWEDNDLTRYAIKQSILYGAKNIKYVSKILDDYKSSGITTIEEAELHSQKKQTKKNKNFNSLETQLESLREKI